VQNDSNPYGFTGEWWQEDVELLHLRARWYAPGTGTFLSVDPVESEPPYQYVRGNPINWIDPSGYVVECNANGYCPTIDRWLCWKTWELGWGAYDNRNQPCIVNPNNVQTGNAPSVPAPPPPLPPSQLPSSPVSFGNSSGLSQQDDRDLTPWLFKVLKAGVGNRDIRFIRSQMRIPTPNNILMANIQWRQLVRDRARYDFKHKIREEFFGETILFRTESRELLWSEYSVPGNIFYGYIGTSAGLGILLHAGAGYAEAVDPAHEEIRNICDVAYFPPERIPTLGDDPVDYRAVQFGIDLWRKYGGSLNLHQLRRELEQNYHQFAPPPVVPGEIGIPSYPWSNPRGGWPYRVGRFNGPDEHKHWPPRLENGLGFFEF
jgi:RHS repeat-associated protein